MKGVRPPRAEPAASSGLLHVSAGRWLAATLLALGAGLLLGGVVGVVTAFGILLGVPRLIGHLSSRTDQAGERSVRRNAAQVADLLCACLASGADIRDSVATVAGAFDGATADSLLAVHAALSLGVPPEEAWRHLEPPSLAHALARSLASGAPLADVLPGIAADLRRQTRTRVESAARSAGVRAVAPLVACFLPAFLLVGVVPVVVGLARSLL